MMHVNHNHMFIVMQVEGGDDNDDNSGKHIAHVHVCKKLVILLFN